MKNKMNLELTSIRVEIEKIKNMREEKGRERREERENAVETSKRRQHTLLT